MMYHETTPRERVRAALDHVEPDFTPCDIFTTPEIQSALCRHFGVSDHDALRQRLGTDIRYVEPPYTGPPLPRYEDGSWRDEWGARRIRVPNEFGEYNEAVDHPYAGWTKVEEAEQFPWPDPENYDYGIVGDLCAKHADMAVAAGRFRVQDFINGVAIGRGVEQVLLDIAAEDPVYLYIVERRHRFYMRHVERILDAAKGRIDLVLCGDDFGTQRGPLISPQTFQRLFADKKREFCDMVHSYGAKVTHHCCGSSRALFPYFAECGIDAIQTIQPQAVGMNPYELKSAFAGRMVLHGAVDVQGWLQNATVQEIRAEVNRLMDEVGRGGGYILSPSHNIQPDTPLENVLAVYDAVARRRGNPPLLGWAS